jgi:predicted enzyme related to lactoylglutathione lyase
MVQPVVHFEIIGTDPQRLHSYYGELFGSEFGTSTPVSTVVSEPTNYGFVDPPHDHLQARGHPSSFATRAPVSGQTFPGDQLA